MRLVIANWLAYYEMPPANRPKDDPTDGWWFYVFYPFGPESAGKCPDALAQVAVRLVAFHR